METGIQDVVDRKFDRLRGVALNLVESWGLPAQQTNAIKAVLKSVTYDSQAVIKAILEADSLLSSSELAGELIFGFERFRVELEEERELA